MLGMDCSEYVGEDMKITKQVAGICFFDEIGRGSFATVYRGKFSLTLGRDNLSNDLAIKEISRQILNDKLMESLKREIEILKSLDNPHIVKLLDVKTTAKSFYLIMEYCNGGNLQQFLKKHKRLEECAVQSIIWQISKGLRTLRSQKIVHRDLKLNNLLITHSRDMTVKIADFGFARVLNDSEEAKSFCGTAPNMAPEILKGYFHS